MCEYIQAPAVRPQVFWLDKQRGIWYNKRWLTILFSEGADRRRTEPRFVGSQNLLSGELL